MKISIAEVSSDSISCPAYSSARTAAGVASYGGAEMNRAVVNVPDRRLGVLASIYDPKKVVPNTIEVVDIPGLKAGSTAAEGHGTKLLGHIKDADALLHVVRCFEDDKIPFEYATADPARDVETIELELMVADSQTLRRKIIETRGLQWAEATAGEPAAVNDADAENH